ncbi:hypothetical protein AYL99_02669 [Fonsecaea erecta]|uniref:Uncharacterized protein n=1 Tax=Fonsecaea erecta TaxID=1367422 RepID=A0A178ZUM7_9EURO|nr:hypothetical protein AYL99_02669 [Fonsecaea erecta]OAP63442.1 hypothetical protein AYL99_02669 [Fonsecaea erecta]
MPAVVINNGVPTGRHESGIGRQPGLPELPSGPADRPSSPALASHAWDAPAAELESRSRAIEAVELSASSTTQRPRRASRYQRHYSTSPVETASINALLAATDAVELDSTPIIAELPAADTHHPFSRQNNAVGSLHSGSAYQAYPGLADLSLSDAPRSPSPLTSSSARAHTRTRSSAVVEQQKPPPDIHDQTHRRQLVSSPVAMMDADSLVPSHARARAKSASLPNSPPYPCPGPKQPTSSYSEPQPQHQHQHQHQTKLPYPLYHGTGTVVMPLHRDYAS